MAASDDQPIAPTPDVEFELLEAARPEALLAHRGELLLAVTGAPNDTAVLASPRIRIDGFVSALDMPERDDAERVARVRLVPGALDLLAHDEGGDQPVLYVATTSLAGGRVLRRADGETFDEVFDGDVNGRRILGLHSLSALGERLFAAPVVPAYSARPEVNCVFVTTDPAAGHWVPAGPANFGDENNLGISALTVWGERVYAGTFNPERGFQLWCTDATGEPPYKWELVVGGGARRYTLNPGVTTMCPFGDALYVATGLPGPGYDMHHDIGPGAGELLRVYADGTWDIIAGSPRFSPDGLKVPLSAMSCGFHNPYNNAVSCLATDGRTLYAATFNCAALLEAELLPEDGRPQVWASDDGENWSRIALGDGGELDGMLGISCLAPSDEGLLIGATGEPYHFRSPVSDEEEEAAGSDGTGGDGVAVVIRMTAETAAGDAD